MSRVTSRVKLRSMININCAFVIHRVSLSPPPPPFKKIARFNLYNFILRRDRRLHVNTWNDVDTYVWSTTEHRGWWPTLSPREYRSTTYFHRQKDHESKSHSSKSRMNARLAVVTIMGDLFRIFLLRTFYEKKKNNIRRERLRHDYARLRTRNKKMFLS